MSAVRHLLNGDAARELLARSGLGGEVHAWSDMLIDGPIAVDLRVPSAADRRARWVERVYGVPAAEYKARHAVDEAWIDASTEADELVLWFEDDHFCGVNLLYLCARLAGPIYSRVHLSLVMAPAPGGLAAESFDSQAAFARRIQLRRAELGRAAAAWRCYCDTDPRAFVGARLPKFLPRFHARWRGRFPDDDGLDDIERATLQLLREGAATPAELFRRVCGDPHAPAASYGLGDLQYWRVLHALHDRALISLEHVRLLPLSEHNTDPREGSVVRGPLHPQAAERVRPGQSDAPVGGAAPSCWHKAELRR